jgi:hypothetical protein
LRLGLGKARQKQWGAWQIALRSARRSRLLMKGCDVGAGCFAAGCEESWWGEHFLLPRKLGEPVSHTSNFLASCNAQAAGTSVYAEPCFGGFTPFHGVGIATHLDPHPASAFSRNRPTLSASPCPHHKNPIRGPIAAVSLHATDGYTTAALPVTKTRWSSARLRNRRHLENARIDLGPRTMATGPSIPYSVRVVYISAVISRSCVRLVMLCFTNSDVGVLYKYFGQVVGLTCETIFNM